MINEGTPASGTIYKDCYVVKVDSTDKANEVLLLYNNDFEINPKEKSEAQVLEEINSELSSLTINNISGWRLPDMEEAKLIIAKSGIHKITNKYYFYLYNNELKLFNCYTLFERNPYSVGERFRPVTILKFKIK